MLIKTIGPRMKANAHQFGNAGLEPVPGAEFGFPNMLLTFN